MKGVEEGDLPQPFAYMPSLEHGILFSECLASASLPFLVLIYLCGICLLQSYCFQWTFVLPICRITGWVLRYRCMPEHCPKRVVRADGDPPLVEFRFRSEKQPRLCSQMKKEFSSALELTRNC